MTKQELIDAIANKTGQSKKDTEAALNAITSTIAETLQAGGEVSIPNVGKLYVKHKPARKGRNPKTGEQIDIAAKKVPDFNPAKALKDVVA